MGRQIRAVWCTAQVPPKIISRVRSNLNICQAHGNLHSFLFLKAVDLRVDQEEWDFSNQSYLFQLFLKLHINKLLSQLFPAMIPPKHLLSKTENKVILF